MPLVKKKVSPTKAREILLQALYQKEISDISNTNLINQFKKAYREFDISNVAEKLKGINKNNDSLNESIANNSSIEIKSIGEIEISILRQSIFEIENSEIDYPIVLKAYVLQNLMFLMEWKVLKFVIAMIIQMNSLRNLSI